MEKKNSQHQTINRLVCADELAAMQKIKIKNQHM
jgi:hypothetical protein